MKVRIYLDVYLWSTDADSMWVTTKPNSLPSAGTKRYAIDVEIPDPAQPHEILSAEAVEMKEGE